MKFTGQILAAAILCGLGVVGAESKEKKPTKEMKGITTDDMDGLVDAFCGAAVGISDAFWDNGGKHHLQADAYPQEACDMAYEAALGALNLAYNYPDTVLFKPTLTTRPFTFRPTIEGALSYFIGTDCLLKAGGAEMQYPPGNTGEFKEYGFGLANYDADGMYKGFDSCDWIPDHYVTGNTVAVAQGQVEFHRKEGGSSIVDKTFSFGIAKKNGVPLPVITGHHSSAIIGPNSSTQYAPPAREGEIKSRAEKVGARLRKSMPSV